MKNKLRVAMLAPPWLTIPPKGYGGIEVMLAGLIPGLRELGVEIELFSVGKTRIKGVKNHWIYKDEQYDHIHKPLYTSAPIISAHLQFSLERILKDGKFDVIHDHNGIFACGPILDWASRVPEMPPIVQTHHGPPFSTPSTIAEGEPDNRVQWEQLGKSKKLFFVGISNAMTDSAPSTLKRQSLKAVHNAVDLTKFKFSNSKKNYFITLARFNRDKNQRLAASLCIKHKFRLKMAGTVAGISTNRQLLLELANPLSKYRSAEDFKYYSDEILPLTIRSPRIQYVGNVEGEEKLNLIANAKALLFPITWDEPFGMAVIEALASGTPVVAMDRGAMPEIIEHGKTGFLAKNEAEFEKYMMMVGEINPEDCRQSVEERFSVNKMSSEYYKRYLKAIQLSNKT